MIEIQLVIAVATPVAAVLSAWLNYRSAAATERERTRRLLIMLQSERESGPEQRFNRGDRAPEALE